MPTFILQQVAVWHAEEYVRRTRLIAADGPAVNMYWLDPAYRVSWTEMWMKFKELGGEMNVLDARLAINPMLAKEMKKRGLMRVWKGKEKAAAWVERNPPAED